MYTSWNRAIDIVLLVNLAAYFLFLGSIMITMEIFGLSCKHFVQCFLLTAVLFIVALIAVMIHGDYIQRKISRGEVRRKVHFDNFTSACCFVSYSGVIVNLIVCCFGTNREIYCTCHIIYAFTNLLMLVFVSRALKSLVMDIEMHKKHLKNVILCQVAGIIILPLLTQHIRTWNEISAIMFSQLICMLYSWNIADYLSIRDGGLEFREIEILLDFNDLENDINSTDSDSSESQIDCSEMYQSTGSLCGVCYRTYSDSNKKKTPLILKNCGHTICEGCAARILKANCNSHLPCPFCRKKTRVDSVTKLPKNYGMLQMLNGMKPMESFNNSNLYENPKLKRRNSFS
ncbi:unnamed protein product [Caenorhabditis nigoni]